MIVFSHRWHRSTQMVRLRSIVPRNTQNAQKSLAVGGCSGSLVGAVLAWLVQWRPLHPLVGCVGMAGYHTLLQLHRLGGCPKISVRICDICGRISQQEVSVNSVNSVGGCSGSLVGAVLAWLVQWRPLHPLVGCVGMAGYHTLLQLHRLGGCPKISVRICDICGRISQQEVSVNSVNSVGGCSGSLVGAVLAWLVHFLLWQAAKPSGDHCTPWKAAWVWQDAIPSYKCTP